MSDVVIQAEGLGKSYLIGHQARGERYTALRDVLARQARGLLSSARRTLRGQVAVAGDQIEEFWALRDVSFEVKRGDVVGIIGRNGAGKSTLLKILSRITEPTEGRVTLRGRVASLLEVGTGFHPELTGSENIFLNGAILGMSRGEIKRKFDEIVAFAEVEQFLDTPVKRYSSGMYVRLAFAVAAHMEPEILVVDEVLAVGDAEFQKKCLGKMSEVAKGGRTVLFVSHNMSAIQSLCTTGIVLTAGRASSHIDAKDAISSYLSQGSSTSSYEKKARLDGTPTITSIHLLTMEQPDYQSVGIRIEGWPGSRFGVDVLLSDRLRHPVGFGSLGTLASSQALYLTSGSLDIQIGIPINSLAIGNYWLSFWVNEPMVRVLDAADYALSFDVVRGNNGQNERSLQQEWNYGCVELELIRLNTGAGVACELA